MLTDFYHSLEVYNQNASIKSSCGYTHFEIKLKLLIVLVLSGFFD